MARVFANGVRRASPDIRGRGGGVARAAPAPNGIYTIVDPYDTNSNGTGSANLLAAAAQTPCSAAVSTSPFCYTSNGAATQSANGVFLQMSWCNFQLTANPLQGFPNWCYYYVNTNTSRLLISPIGGTLSTCAAPGFDTCNTGLLAAALKNIVAINARRHAAGLTSDLTISVGLEAGYATALDVLNDTQHFGTIALPSLPSQPNNQSAQTYDCVLLPNVFAGKYITDYVTALKSLVNFIATFDHGALKADIAIVKLAPVNTITSEFDMDGSNVHFTTNPDPNNLVNCPTSSGAQAWLDDFTSFPSANLDPNCAGGSLTVIAATECAFGDAVGSTLAALSSQGLSNVVLSVPTQNGNGLPYLDCGFNGSSACAVQAPSSKDKWSLYYLFHFVKDLFVPGSQAYYAASHAASSAGGTYGLTAAELATDFTSLTPTPIAANTNITCGLNNNVAADDQQFILNGATVSVPGIPGSLIRWQTHTQQGQDCATTYATTLTNGITNGGQFIEVQSDAAFTDRSSCGPPLNIALTSLLQATPPGACQY